MAFAPQPIQSAKRACLGLRIFLYNLSLVYEKYGLSARAAYQFRKAWQNGIGTYLIVNGVSVPDGVGDNYWDDDAELDISIRYEINKNLTVTFDATNVLDEAGIRYADPRFVGTSRIRVGKVWPTLFAGSCASTSNQATPLGRLTT
jgi:outer membrane receptor protein involved in Fe transport